MPIAAEGEKPRSRHRGRWIIAGMGVLLLLLTTAILPLYHPVHGELGAYGFSLSAKPPESGALPASGWHFSRFPGETNVWLVIRTDRDGYHGLQYSLSWWHRK